MAEYIPEALPTVEEIWRPEHARRRAGVVRLGPALALLALLLSVWQLLAWAHTLPAYLVSPATVGEQVLALARSGELLAHSAASLFRSAAGLALGAAIGVALGLLAGVLPVVDGFVDPLVSLTYPVPKVAMLPVLMVWFGITDTSKILLIALTCFYPCFIAAHSGARSVQRAWIWTAQNMGADPRQRFLRVIVPAAAPQIFSGLRVALALAFILMLASEMIGSSNRLGLGFLILSADAGGRFDLMFAVVAVIGTLGFTADRLLVWVRRKLMPAAAAAEEAWHG